MLAKAEQRLTGCNRGNNADRTFRKSTRIWKSSTWNRHLARRVLHRIQHLYLLRSHEQTTQKSEVMILKSTNHQLFIDRLSLNRHGMSVSTVLALTFVILAIVCAFQPRAAFGRPSKGTSSDQESTWTPVYSLFWGLSKETQSKYDIQFADHIKSNWNTKSSWHPFRWSRAQTKCTGDYSSDLQLRAVDSLLSRQFPYLPSKVLFSRQITCPDHNGCFSMHIEDGHLCIRGSSGVDLATGFHWFLKKECQGMSTWEKTGSTQYKDDCLTPSHLTRLEENSFHFSKSRNIPLSFYQNVVTSSYSMTYWNWSRWETEIDWMALHGVNLPLALRGEEYIWTKVYKDLGIKFEDLEDFFTGPSFLAWGRMGNIQGYGGPLPWSYIESQSKLQLKIVERMRSFGMTPIFSGFAGFVPRAFAAKYPEAKVKKSSNWCEFPEQYCCVLILDPTDPFFNRIGSLFLKYQRQVYGFDKVGFYAVDVFNEMTPVQSDPSYLKKTSEAVYSVLQSVESCPIWIMQGWLFYSDREFWKQDQIKAVLSGVPSGHLLLLDLYAERHPQWKRTDAFFGLPFIWCNLHNFGGNIEMHGALPQITQGVYDARMAGGNVVGVGMCPEGLEQNPVVYELTSEIAYRDKPPALRSWLDGYVVQRYGGRECKQAFRGWKMLSESVYENTGHRSETMMDIPVSRPGLDPKEAFWGLKPQVWYNPNKVIEAWKCLLECTPLLSSLSSFKYDLVDVGRQALSKLATKYWKQVTSAYHKKDHGELREAGDRLLELLDDMDLLLSTHQGFLFGPLLQEAGGYGETPMEKQLMEQNLKLQVTIWGESPTGDTELSDYANRQSSGLMSSFYRERWRRWIERLKTDLRLNRVYNRETFLQEMNQFTYDWISNRQLDEFRTSPRSDCTEISQRLYEKYRDEAWVLEMSI